MMEIAMNGLGMILFWIFLVVGIMFFIKYLFSSGKSAAGSKTALEILKSRYASGEISKEDYEKLKKDILSS